MPTAKSIPTPSSVALVMAGETSLARQLVGPVESLLSPEEQSRTSSFRSPRDRLDFEAAHALVRVCAAQVLGISPGQLTVVQRCDTCGGPHGRPFLAEVPEFSVSISHTRGYVAVAANDKAIGVDVETLDGFDFDSDMAEMIVTDDERATIDSLPDSGRGLLRQWVRKECLIKVGMCRLDGMKSLWIDPFATVAILPEGSTWRFSEWSTASGLPVLGCAVASTMSDIRLITR